MQGKLRFKPCVVKRHRHTPSYDARERRAFQPKIVVSSLGTNNGKYLPSFACLNVIIQKPTQSVIRKPLYLYLNVIRR